MRSLLIGDLHFGVKSNSLSWLQSQLDFFDKQVLDIIKNKDIDKVIFLGDIHDIRYSVNQQVGICVRDLFRKMLDSYPDKRFIVLAGNHDYYSPLEELAYYNFYELMFGDEFKKCHPNLVVVNTDPLLDDDGSLYLPWYWTESPEHFDDILYNYKFGTEVKAVYCHADLMTWPGPRVGSLRGCPVYSGHIHNVNIDELSKLYNVGSALALTYADVNDPKYLYILDDHKIVEKVVNSTTPQFKRIYNDEIFNVTAETFDNANVQLCISSSNMYKANYIEQIKHIKLTYIDSNIKIHILDENTDFKTLDAKGINTNIKSYISNNIPNHLTSKYNKIKKLLDK